MKKPDDPQDMIAGISKKWGTKLESVVIATDKRLMIGEMLPFAGQRFVVTEELTKEQFRARAKANFDSRKKTDLGDADHMGVRCYNQAGRTTEGQWVDGGPDPEMRWFYALRRLG